MPCVFTCFVGMQACSRPFSGSSGVPPSQPPKIAQNGFLETFFESILRSSWGSPLPALEKCLEWLPGSILGDYFRFFLGSPQPALETGSEWLPGVLFPGKGVGPGFSFRCFFCRRHSCQGLTLERRRILFIEFLRVFGISGFHGRMTPCLK